MYSGTVPIHPQQDVGKQSADVHNDGTAEMYSSPFHRPLLLSSHTKACSRKANKP